MNTNVKAKNTKDMKVYSNKINRALKMEALKRKSNFKICELARLFNKNTIQY